MFEVLNDPLGKLVILQAASLKPWKKLYPTEVILLISNDQLGKLVNAQLLLKQLKKLLPAQVIFEVSNDQSGKLVNAHWKLKELKK